MTVTMTLIMTVAKAMVDAIAGVELITGTTRHLRRSDEERARILAESFEPGANMYIAAVARKNGVNGGLLHYWRRRARAQQLCEATPTRGTAVCPVTMADPSARRVR